MLEAHVLLYLAELSFIEVGECGRDLRNLHDLHVVTTTISGAGCWKCMRENLPLSITTHPEERYTL